MDIELLKDIRATRDLLLVQSDWTQMSDSPLADIKKNEWKVYRQALRDLPHGLDVQSFSQVIWPTEPA